MSSHDHERIDKTMNQTPIEALLQHIRADEEFQAWKAAHPERKKRTDSMTREELNSEIIILLEQLGICPPASDVDSMA